MLEKKDLEMIAEIVKETNKPIHERLDKMETKVTEVQMKPTRKSILSPKATLTSPENLMTP